MKETVKYYEENSKSYLESTETCNMEHLYDFFLPYVKKEGLILDIGFGSGRDMLYFKSKGYRVKGIDPTSSFVLYAKEKGLDVEQISIEDIDENEKYDAIWACASLLHVEKEKLPSVLKKCYLILKKDGVMYASFKYGDFAGMRNGRYFVDLEEESLLSLLKNTGLEMIESKITLDVRKDREKEKWLNVILRKI